MFADFIGQNHIKDLLTVTINTYKQTAAVLPHMLITGSSGCGKTTLANAIAKEYDCKCFTLFAKGLTYDDIIHTLSLMHVNDILFIDEIHTLNKKVIEHLFSLMSDNIIHYKFNGTLLTIEVPKITILGATTHQGMLLEALRNRFVLTLMLHSYTQEDIRQMLLMQLNDVQIDETIVNELVSLTRLVPRTLNNILTYLRMYINTHVPPRVSVQDIQAVKTALGIYKYGLTTDDIKILSCLDKTDTISVKSLSNMTNIESINILQIHEPYLQKCGFLKVTNKGRSITMMGRKYLQEIKPEDT